MLTRELRQYPESYPVRVEAVDLVVDRQRDIDLENEPAWMDQQPPVWQMVLMILFIAGLLAVGAYASWWALVEFLMTVEEEERFGRSVEVPYTYRAR